MRKDTESITEGHQFVKVLFTETKECAVVETAVRSLLVEKLDYSITNHRLDEISDDFRFRCSKKVTEKSKIFDQQVHQIFFERTIKMEVR